MAITIQSNATALGAQTNLNIANNKLSKTIAQLSSGFRINSAADDASGLAVSEKLRGQISGLSKAASNAQDGISMLQTAEGAMGSMTSIVQRMRELAVQAGDPAYTTNDRAMLQLEVDQLKEEINRVSSSTEFNTKKLLNGDAAALWSSSSANVEAIVRGAADEGNYKVESMLNAGKNDVYKSEIMTLKEGALSANVLGSPSGVKGVNGLNNLYTSKQVNSVTTTTGVAGAAGSVRTYGNMNPYLTVNAHTGIATAQSNAILGGTGGFSDSVLTDMTLTATTGAATMLSGTVYMEMESVTDKAGAGTGSFKFRFTNALTGVQSEWSNDTIISANGTLTTAQATALNALAQTTGVTGNVMAVSAGSTASKLFTNAEVVSKGDKLLVTVSGRILSAQATTNGTISLSSGTGVTTIQVDNIISTTADKKSTITIAQMDKNGSIKYGSLDLTMTKNTRAPLSAAATLISTQVLGGGDIASKQTKLSDLTTFINADGRNLLANTQELKIYGNGNEAIIYLEGSDTIEDFENKLTSAIVDQLGMGSSDSAAINENLVNYVGYTTAGASAATANTNEAAQGTFVIQSALIGKDSKLSFVGDQGIINALALANIQNATDSALTVKVSDAHTGKEIGSDTVTDGRLRGVIGGVDVKVNAAAAVNIGWDSATKTLTYSQKTAVETAYLHIKDNATKAAIGANEGQTIDLSIGRMDTISLEIDEVNVVSFDNAQSSITKLDQALEKISASRAKVGAQMNRLDYTITNLNNARENLSASESRIRDLDIAQASTELAARQVMLQSATAMLAQANQLPSYAAQLLR